MGNYNIVVLDFETSGLSPDNGDRAIEIGAVRIQNNRVVDRFQSLMNPGIVVSSFIEGYTGITNQMLKTAPPAAEVMQQFAVFMSNHHLVAHNASFDRRFLDAELQRVSLTRRQEFACSLMLSRRLHPDAPGHSLETLVRYKKLKTAGVFHRALADAEMTAQLWIGMIADLKREHRLGTVPFELMQHLMELAKPTVPDYLKRLARHKGSTFLN